MPVPIVAADRTARPEIPAQSGPGVSGFAILLMVIAALYFGRDIFVPMALAVLLSFALSPLVSRLRKLRVPRTIAVIVVVAFAFLAISAFGMVVAGQVSSLGENLPRYQANIQQKIQDFRAGPPGSGLFERAADMLRELSEEISRPAADQTLVTEESDTRQGEPIPVEIRQPEPAPLEILQNVIGPLVAPLATGGVVIVFVIFMLLQREDLRDRFIRLAGGGDLQLTTRALSDAGKRVARYLLMQLIVNATYGVPVGVGLWLIGVPNPLLWGLLAMVLRFVPYIGPVIAALFPLALSIAVDPGWTMLFWTAALFIVLELTSNNVVEPWLYGSSTGLSPVAIIAAAIFWTWLWGPIGLLLSTPLTVCLVVLGQHVPHLAFLDVLFGNEPVLTPPESLYQRLLAGDPDEATERAEDYLDEKPILAFYEEVAVPALAMMEHDRTRGVLDEERRELAVEGMFTLVDNLAEHEDSLAVEEAEAEAAEAEADADAKTDATDAKKPVAAAPAPLPALAAEWHTSPVLCAGGRGNLDDAAAAMLAQMFERHGIGVRRASFEAMATTNYARLDLEGVRLVCLSYMNPNSIAHARYLVRRLRRRGMEAKIMVGFWTVNAEAPAKAELLKATHADMLAISLGDALSQVVELAPRVAVETAGQAVEQEAPVAPPAQAGLQPVPT